jgi:hypothetical protein
MMVLSLPCHGQETNNLQTIVRAAIYAVRSGDSLAGFYTNSVKIFESRVQMIAKVGARESIIS